MNEDRVDLAQVFQKYSRRISEDFDLAGASTPHKGSKGDRRETILKEFLSESLPKVVGVSDGHVFDTNNKISRQMDIIMYSKLGLSLRERRIRLFPADCVLGIGEVKSYLDKEEIEKTLQSFHIVKQMKVHSANMRSMHFRERILGCVFAFDSDKQETVRRNLFDYYESHHVPEEEKVDLIYVHRKFVGVRKPSEYGITILSDDGSRDFSGMDIVCAPAREDSLIVLLMLLHNCMNNPSELTRDYLPYLSALGQKMEFEGYSSKERTKDAPEVKPS